MLPFQVTFICLESYKTLQNPTTFGKTLSTRQTHNNRIYIYIKKKKKNYKNPTEPSKIPQTLSKRKTQTREYHQKKDVFSFCFASLGIDPPWTSQWRSLLPISSCKPCAQLRAQPPFRTRLGGPRPMLGFS